MTPLGTALRGGGEARRAINAIYVWAKLLRSIQMDEADRAHASPS